MKDRYATKIVAEFFKACESNTQKNRAIDPCDFFKEKFEKTFENECLHRSAATIAALNDAKIKGVDVQNTWKKNENGHWCNEIDKKLTVQRIREAHKIEYVIDKVIEFICEQTGSNESQIHQTPASNTAPKPAPNTTPNTAAVPMPPQQPLHIPPDDFPVFHPDDFLLLQPMTSKEYEQCMAMDRETQALDDIMLSQMESALDCGDMSWLNVIYGTPTVELDNLMDHFSEICGYQTPGEESQKK